MLSGFQMQALMKQTYYGMALSVRPNSAAYIQMHFKQDFLMEWNTIYPGADWSGSILFAI